MGVSRLIGICRGSLLAFCASAALGFAPPAQAAQPGSACNRQSVSALNQYCEDIPGAGGPKTPGVGTPAVGRRLPSHVLHELAGGGSGSALPSAVRLRLRALPAATPARHRHRPTPTPPNRSVSTASVWSMSPALLWILAGIALALLAIAAERWRRRRVAAPGD